MATFFSLHYVRNWSIMLKVCRRWTIQTTVKLLPRGIHSAVAKKRNVSKHSCLPFCSLLKKVVYFSFFQKSHGESTSWRENRAVRTIAKKEEERILRGIKSSVLVHQFGEDRIWKQMELPAAKKKEFKTGMLLCPTVCSKAECISAWCQEIVISCTPGLKA